MAQGQEQQTTHGGFDAHHDPGGGSAVPVLGVDVGGVIVRRVARDEDTSFFGSQPLRTEAVEGVIEALALLTAGPFEGRVHVVSKAGPKVAANTRAWLEHHAFFHRTGIPAEHLTFVRERADKAPVCVRLGVTHFVDDRVDVLAHLTSVGHRYLFTGGLVDLEVPAEVPSWATVADTWAALVEAMQRPSADVLDAPSSGR